MATSREAVRSQLGCSYMPPCWSSHTPSPGIIMRMGEYRLLYFCDVGEQEDGVQRGQVQHSINKTHMVIALGNLFIPFVTGTCVFLVGMCDVVSDSASSLSLGLRLNSNASATRWAGNLV